MFRVLLDDIGRDAGANVIDIAHWANLAAGESVIDAAGGRLRPAFQRNMGAPLLSPAIKTRRRRERPTRLRLCARHRGGI